MSHTDVEKEDEKSKVMSRFKMWVPGKLENNEKVMHYLVLCRENYQAFG